MDQDKINQYREQQATDAEKAKQQANHDELAGTLNNLLLATMVSKNPEMVKVAEDLSKLLNGITQASDQFGNSSLHLLPLASSKLADAVNELTSRLDKSPTELAPYFEKLSSDIAEVAGRTPIVNVPQQPIKLDLAPLQSAIRELQTEVKNSKIDVPKTDFSNVLSGLAAIKSSIDNQQFPVPNYILPFKDANGRAVQVQLDASGNIPTTGGGGSGGAQYADGAARGTATGTLSMVDDGTNIQSLAGDTSGRAKVLINDTLGNAISAFPATFLRTSDEPHQVFYDPFDTTLDVTNYWTSTTGSSGVAASTTTGVMSMGTGTVANGYSKLTSIATFKPTIPAWLGISDAITIPDLASPTSNAYRFWGEGTTPATPTATAPLTDAVGFELSTAGKMFAVVYAGGTRTVIQDLSSATGNATQPTDANQHRYIVYIRTDKAYWYIDGITSAQLVATSNFQAPQVQTLPKLFLAVGGSTPPGSNSQIQCNGATAWDTGKNTYQMSDGTYPWIKANITQITGGAGNALLVAGSYKELSGLTSAITGASLMPSTDVSAYKWVSVHITSISTTVNFEGSNDNFASSVIPIPLNRLSVALSTPSTTTTAADIYAGPVQFRYMRIRQSGAGASAAVVELYTSPTATLTVGGQVALNGTSAVSVSSQIPGTGATNLGKAEDAVHASSDVGVMALAVSNESLTNISGTDGDYTPIGVDRSGTVHVAQKASTATLTNVAASATSVTLLSANAARIGAQVTNDSSSLIYIKFGTTASTTSYTVVLAGAASAPFSYYEVPAGYTGRIDAIWASAAGNARITEITP